MKLKIEKGFNINKEEAETSARQEMKGVDSTVSSALSQNQPNQLGINLDQINIGTPTPKNEEKKVAPPKTSSAGLDDLLGLDD